LLRWKVSPTKSVPAGTIAGSEHDKGYLRVRVGTKIYYAHRLIWKWMTGEWPTGQVIDHINGNPADNRWTNLRLATPSQNQHNRGANRKSQTGQKGVDKFRNKFRARVMVDGKYHLAGYFDTVEMAAEALDVMRHRLIADYIGGNQ